MGKLATAFKLGGTALFIGICALLLMLSLPKSGWKALSVQTGSMRPAIAVGDLVLVHHVPASELQIGDVITYVNLQNKKQTITHRIVAINGPQITVKCDANRSTDAPISASTVVGKVSYSLPRVGNALNFTRETLGMWMLLALGVYLPALLIMISEARRLAEHYRKTQPYISPQIRSKLRLRRPTVRGRTAVAAKLTVFLVVVSIAIAWPVKALLSSQATLTDNTMSAVVPPCSGSNTNINISGGGGNNTVVVNNSNNQTATSGNATGNNATTGNVSNINCMNINITITNH